MSFLLTLALFIVLFYVIYLSINCYIFLFKVKNHYLSTKLIFEIKIEIFMFTFANSFLMRFFQENGMLLFVNKIKFTFVIW